MFHLDLNQIKKILKKNFYPEHLIDKTIKRYLNEKFSSNSQEKSSSDTSRYFKLPFIGRYSDVTKNKIQSLTKKLCKDIDVKIVFNSFKIKDLFSTKDPLPSYLKSNVVYKFSCASCNACYIGETTRHLSQRIDEHLRKDKNSHIYKHLHENLECFDNCTNACFSILDSATTTYQLKIKEGLHIEWEKPMLNKQVFHVSSTLS